MVSQETVAKVIDLLHDEGVCQEYAACSSDEDVMELLHGHDIEVDSVQELKDAVRDTISNMSEEELNGGGGCFIYGYLGDKYTNSAFCMVKGAAGTDLGGKSGWGAGLMINVKGGHGFGFGGFC